MAKVIIIDFMDSYAESIYPFQLASLALLLKKLKLNVFGLTVDQSNFNTFLKEVLEEKYSTVCFRCTRFNGELIKKFFVNLKGKLNANFIWFGNEKLYLKMSKNIDSEILFFENTFSEDFLKNIYRIYTKKNDCFNYVNNLLEYDRYLFSFKRYRGMVTKYSNYMQVLTSIGCNNYCAYCSDRMRFPKWKGRSLENVIGEIIGLKEKAGIKEIHIEDMNFFGGGLERVRKFCLLLKEKNLGVVWQCPGVFLWGR